MDVSKDVSVLCICWGWGSSDILTKCIFFNFYIKTRYMNIYIDKTYIGVFKQNHLKLESFKVLVFHNLLHIGSKCFWTLNLWPSSLCKLVSNLYKHFFTVRGGWTYVFDHMLQLNNTSGGEKAQVYHRYRVPVRQEIPTRKASPGDETHFLPSPTKHTQPIKPPKYIENPKKSLTKP